MSQVNKIQALKEEYEKKVRDYERIVEDLSKKDIKKYGHQENYFNGRYEEARLILGRLEELLKWIPQHV